MRERIWRQTRNAALAARLVPAVAREDQLMSRAALLRGALGQRLDVPARPDLPCTLLLRTFARLPDDRCHTGLCPESCRTPHGSAL